MVYPCLAGAGYFRSVARPGLAVITYHGVLPPGYKPIDPGFDGSLITAETFRQQLRLLKKKYTVISPEEMRAWCQGGVELPPRAALLTCDDGFLNNLTEMVPVLRDEGLRCLFFRDWSIGWRPAQHALVRRIAALVHASAGGKFQTLFRRALRSAECLENASSGGLCGGTR